MTDAVRLGVIGLGLIAQTRHMQLLREIPTVSMVAVCDQSPATAEAVGERFHVAKRCTDYKEILADESIEAVAIFTYDHAQIVLDAIHAGKHVFVEKPLAFTPDEAQAIVSAAEDRGVTVMLGYMKLYDPAFEWAAERIRGQGKPRSIHVHDYGGNFESLRRKDILPLRFDDVQDSEARFRQKWSQSVIDRAAEALGPEHAGYAELYTVLLMLGCHDLGVLCGALGEPERVSYAQPVGDRRALAVLEYPGGVPCFLDVGVGAKYEWWDEHLTVHGEADEVRLEFGNPFLPFSPTTVRVREADGDARSERFVNIAYDDAFRREWLHFAECLRARTSPRSGAAEGLRDIRLCVEIIRAMQPRSRADLQVPPTKG